jgi:tetratricopeptide (TPR) repeat protein
MTSRTRSHVLEDLSREAFKRLLIGPLGWVVRDIPIDYGIDVEVEIFSPDGSKTGLTFKVQLKGMEAPDRIGPFRDVALDHVRYWRRLDVPVLLIAYDDSTESVYGRWIHSLDLDVKPDQKTVRIRFSEEDRIVSGEPRLLPVVENVQRLRSGAFGRPYPVRLAGEASPSATHDFLTAVRSFGLDDYVRFDRSDFSFSVEMSQDVTRVALPAEVGSLTIHYETTLTAEEQAGDALMVLAGLLARMNRFGEALRVVRSAPSFPRALLVPELAVEISSAAYELNDHELLTLLAAESLGRGHFDTAQMYMVVLRQLRESDWFDACRAVLEPAVEACIVGAVEREEPEVAARWSYNFAQFLFERKHREDARSWVERALQLDPDGYGRRPEPHRLLGAISWFANDYDGSAEAYRVAVDVGGIGAAGSRLADSLMHAGRYREARDIIQTVFDHGSTNWRDAFVAAILDEIVEHLRLDVQTRREYPPVGTVLPRRQKKLQRLLIDGDALNGSVWTALCLRPGGARLTTGMAAAFLSSEPVLMALAVRGMIHSHVHGGGEDDDLKEMLSRLLFDSPNALKALLDMTTPMGDDEEAAVLNEVIMRSMERIPDPPGIQFVDQYNVPLEADSEDNLKDD